MQQELVDYIKAAKAQGLNDTIIKQNLSQAGWEVHEVDGAFLEVGKTPGPEVHGDFGIEPSGASATILPGQSSFESITQNSSNYVSPSVKSKKWIWILVTVLVFLGIIGGGIAFAYSQGYRVVGMSVVKPMDVWQRFTQLGMPQIYSSSYFVEFSDKGEIKELEQALGFALKDPKLRIDAKDFSNSTGTRKTETQGTYVFTNGGFSAGGGLASGEESRGDFDLRQIGHKVFIDISKLPFYESIKALFVSMKADESLLGWLLFDLDKLSGNLQSNATDYEAIESEFRDSFDMSKIASNAVLAGSESINGTTALKYSVVIDKSKLASGLNKAMAKQYADLPDAEKRVSELTSSLNVKDAFVWLDSDGMPVKVRYVITTPSIISIVQSTMSGQKPTGTAEIIVEQVFSGIGEDREVSEPEKYFDLSELVNQEGLQDVTLPSGQ